MGNKIGVPIVQGLDVPNFFKDVPNFMKDVQNFIKTFKLIFMFFLGVFRKQNVFVAEAARLPILPHF